MNGYRLEVVEIATGQVVHTIPAPNTTPGTTDAQRLMRGILNNIGRFNCELSRGRHEEVDDRLDLDRYFVREAGA